MQLLSPPAVQAPRHVATNGVAEPPATFSAREKSEQPAQGAPELLWSQAMVDPAEAPDNGVFHPHDGGRPPMSPFMASGMPVPFGHMPAWPPMAM